MDPSSLCLSTSSSAFSTTSQQKLKNACDLCSAVKIRCDKGKPSCGRCANLSQPCSYSPARRAGRPRRLRQQHQHQQQQQQQQGPEQQQQQLGTFLTSCFNDHHINFDTGDFDWGSYDWGMESGEANPANATSSQMPLRADHNHAVFTINKSATQMPLSTEHVNQQFKEQPPPGADNCVPPPISAGRTSHGDCARTAASIVEQLDPGRKAACRAPPTESSSKITTVCQRLLTILVCPCSEQPVVGRLVASACIALIDAVLYQQQQQYLHTASPSHHHQQQAPHEALSSFTWPLTPSSPHHHHPRSLPLPASLNDYYSDQSEFEGLAKIAKVVLRFMQRYTQDEGAGGGGATRALVEPIVILLRSKLQFVTKGFIDRVVL
ncbi:hypothetical protein VTK56DRAFT_2109 [Thermocarpiscus australiensis]